MTIQNQQGPRDWKTTQNETIQSKTTAKYFQCFFLFTIYATQGPKTRRLSFSTFLLNHILPCICFTILFTVSKYLVSNLSYTHLIKTIKNVKKTNKTFNIFRVIIIVRNHYFIIQKLSSIIKGFILYQIKQTASKSGYNFTTYGKFMHTS